MNRNSVSLVIKVLLLCSVFASLFLYWQEREQAQQDAAQFKTAVRAAGAGQWFWDIEKNVLRWDARMFELFHQSAQDWKWVDGSWEWQGGADSTPAEFFGACVLDADREFVFKELQRAIDTKGSYQAVFRVLGSDGNIYPIRSGGAVFGGGRYMTGLCLRAIMTGAAPTVLDTTAIQAGPRSGPTQRPHNSSLVCPGMNQDSQMLKLACSPDGLRLIEWHEKRAVAAWRLAANLPKVFARVMPKSIQTKLSDPANLGHINWSFGAGKMAPEAAGAILPTGAIKQMVGNELRRPGFNERLLDKVFHREAVSARGGGRLPAFNSDANRLMQAGDVHEWSHLAWPRVFQTLGSTALKRTNIGRNIRFKPLDAIEQKSDPSLWWRGAPAPPDKNLGAWLGPDGHLSNNAHIAATYTSPSASFIKNAPMTAGLPGALGVGRVRGSIYHEPYVRYGQVGKRVNGELNLQGHREWGRETAMPFLKDNPIKWLRSYMPLQAGKYSNWWKSVAPKDWPRLQQMYASYGAGMALPALPTSNSWYTSLLSRIRSLLSSR